MVLKHLPKTMTACFVCLAATALVLQSGCNGAENEQDEPADDRADSSSKNKDSDGKDSGVSETDGDDSEGDDSEGDADSGGVNDATGGGDSASAQDPALMNYSAGSRLKPLVVSASDGAKQFYGWYDSELEVPCTFGMLSHATPPPKDGATLRCLPAMLRLELNEYYDSNSCKDDPIGIGRPVGCDDPTTFKYGKVLPSEMCGGEAEIKKIKSVTPLTSSDYIWYKDRNGYCKMVDTDIAPFVFVEVGDNASLDDFVDGTTKD